MFYLALFLIFTGLVLIVFSLISSNKKSITRTVEKSFYPGKSSENAGSLPGTSIKSNPSNINHIAGKSGEEGLKKSSPPGDLIMDAGPIDQEVERAEGFPGNENYTGKTKGLKSGPVKKNVPENDMNKKVLSANKNKEVPVPEDASQEGSIVTDQQMGNGELLDDKYYVILYEDSSGAIDYENDDNVIDSTLQTYKKIKRIGRGYFELYKDGVNFYIGNKFFRYDFHSMKTLKAGDKYIAILLKGSDIVRLFIFEKEAPLKLNIKKSYHDFLGRTG